MIDSNLVTLVTTLAASGCVCVPASVNVGAFFEVCELYNLDPSFGAYHRTLSGAISGRWYYLNACDAAFARDTIDYLY